MPSWIPVAISGTGTIIALVAFSYQVHRARFNQSVDLLFRLENDFFGSVAKKRQRALAATKLLEGQSDEAEPILDFFETMALLLKRGALDREMVWHTFYYWIDHYYAATFAHIRDQQREDPLVWQDFESLVVSVRALQKARSHSSGVELSPQEIERFLTEEMLEAQL